MGGMYNAVLGDGQEMERAWAFTRVLGLRRRDFGRLRDAWVEAHGDTCVLAFYTRNGGGNRPDYEDISTALQSHPQFITDDDDEFDTTYRTYRFEFPGPLPDYWLKQGLTQKDWDEVHADFMRKAHPGQVNMSAVWRQAIAKVEREGMSEDMMKKVAENVQIMTFPNPPTA